MHNAPLVLHAPNLHTKNLPTQIRRLELPGRLPTDRRVPPLRIPPLWAGSAPRPSSSIYIYIYILHKYIYIYIYM